MNTPLQSLLETELDELVTTNDVMALVEKAHRLQTAGELNKAKDFYTLASVLGSPLADIELAKILESEDKLDDAYELYAKAYHRGEYSALKKICDILLETDRELAIEILSFHALNGDTECIDKLIELYNSDKNNPKTISELNFWNHQKSILEKELQNKKYDL
ncbi:MAG: hypothetical protein FWE13_04705 [Firmicutes bacterium]|nr:hypothetical protein [Bacillota bacterium]